MRIQLEIRKKQLRENSKRGIIKDISIGGLGIILENSGDNNSQVFQLKDIVEIKAKLPKGSIRIAQAIVVRVSQDGDELGIQYNLTNPDMVETESSHAISSFILEWLESLLNSVV